MTKKLLIYLLIALTTYSCTTVRSQEEKWANKKIGIQKSINKYPTVAPLLQLQLDDAEEEYMSAQEIVDKEDKIDQLEIAILKLSSAPFKTILKFEDAINEAKVITNKIQQDFTPQEYNAKTAAMVDYASQQLTEATKIQEDTYSDADAQLRTFKNSYKKLNEEVRDLEQVYSSVMLERQRIKDSTINANAQQKAREDTSTNILD